MRNVTRSVALAALFSVSTGAQPAVDRGDDAIAIAALKAHVQFLAADEMKGRDSLSPESRIAANYVASFFARAGLKPIGEGGTYFQHFPMVEQRLDQQRSYLKATIANASGGSQEQISPLVRTSRLGRNGPDATVDAPLVFGGYGDDDFRSVDVKGKVVLLMLREPPGGERFGGRMNIGETKSDVARKRGAVAILTVRSTTSLAPRPSPAIKSGPVSGSAVTGMRPAGQDRMTVPHMLVNPHPDVPTAAVSERVADLLLAPAGKTVAAFRTGYARPLGID